jgi:uncharacterized protein YhaN
MIIKKLHIDNFGIFQNYAIDDFKPGLNVICGNNESGKTTLAEFIKRTLFRHIDRRSNLNTYNLSGTTNFGGTMFCCDANGTEFSIARHGVSSGGKVSVTRDGTVYGGEMLNQFIAVSESFYRNIYAITIEELHSAEFMDNEELRNRLFSAGLETGAVSLIKVRDQIESEMEEFFKPRGSNNPMRSLADRAEELQILIREAESRMSKVDELQNELAANKRQANALKNEQQQAQLEISRLERRGNAYGLWLKLRLEKEKLKKLPQGEAIPADAITRLTELKSSLKHAKEQLEKTHTQHRKASDELATVKPNTALLAVANEITGLFREVQTVRERRLRIDQLEREQRTMQLALDNELRSLGEEWNEAKLQSFSGGKILAERLREFKDELSRLEREYDKARAVADILPQQTSMVSSRQVLLWIIDAMVFIIGALVIILKSVPVGIFCIIAALIFAFFSSRSGSKENPVQTNADPCAKIETELESIKKQVGALLEGAGLTPELSPESALVCLAGIEKCTELMQKLHAARDELTKLEAAQKEFDGKDAALNEKLNRESSADPVTGSEMLQEELLRARDENSRRQAAEKSLSNIATELNAAQSQEQSDSEAYNNFLQEFKVENEAQFRFAAEQSAERAGILQKIENLESPLAENCAQDDYKTFTAELEKYSPDDSAIRKNELLLEGENTDTQLRELNQSIGSLKEQLRAIEDSRQLESNRTELDSIKKRLHRLSREWTRRRLALHLLDQAVAKFEKERRPGVIKTASEYFKILTSGAYVDVLQRLEDNSIVVNGADGSVKQVDELSRGTREELLLCMRLGVVAEFEKTAESLPLILDDVLVDFDDIRRSETVKMLAKFAKNRQVIIMSCHHETVELYQNAGANIIQF